jgi:hypothetical protein
MTTDVNERTRFLHWGEEEHKGGPITCNNTHTKEQASTKTLPTTLDQTISVNKVQETREERNKSLALTLPRGRNKACDDDMHVDRVCQKHWEGKPA